MTRDELRQAILERLDTCALEHPSGHQGSKAARYLILTRQGGAVELMFEKGPASAPNLWAAERYVAELLENGAFEFRRAPASALFTTKGKDGKAQYGRHSALKSMKELSHADLVCIRLAKLGELDQILEHIDQGF
ncbi:hypothetical protein DZK27_09225 [Rhodobacteraceae bacterium 63075]|nr:hypothetical protein DZK27_09225 [Rhodobacteraceae bacterium 63075]